MLVTRRRDEEGGAAAEYRQPCPCCSVMDGMKCRRVVSNVHYQSQEGQRPSHRRISELRLFHRGRDASMRCLDTPARSCLPKVSSNAPTMVLCANREGTALASSCRHRRPRQGSGGTRIGIASVAPKQRSHRIRRPETGRLETVLVVPTGRFDERY